MKANMRNLLCFSAAVVAVALAGAETRTCLFTPDDGVPQDLPIVGWTATVDGKDAELVVRDHSCGSHHFREGWVFEGYDSKDRHVAVLDATFDVPVDGTVSAGMTADWFFDLAVDGLTVFSTDAGGNGTCEYGYWNQTAIFSVKAGRHALRVTLKNGLGKMMFALGKPAKKPPRVTRIVTLDETLDAARRVWASDVNDRSNPQRLEAMVVLQHAVNMTSSADAVKFARNGADATLFEKAPALAVVNAGIDRVLKDVPQTEVEPGSVAVWYLYDMGHVVKTSGGTVFGIDVSCPRDDEIAELLDFALVTHNHSDHASERLLRAMQKNGGFANGKPVVSAFQYTPYVARTPHTYVFGDCTVETGVSDHNPHWKESMTPYKVTCGKGADAVTILHHGDGWDASQVAHFGHVDIAIVHVWPWDRHNGQETAQVLKPNLLVLSHAQELTHGFGPGRWGWEQCEEEALLATEAGQVIYPIWGEKFVWKKRSVRSTPGALSFPSCEADPHAIESLGGQRFRE